MSREQVQYISREQIDSLSRDVVRSVDRDRIPITFRRRDAGEGLGRASYPNLKGMYEGTAIGVGDDVAVSVVCIGKYKQGSRACWCCGSYSGRCASS